MNDHQKYQNHLVRTLQNPPKRAGLFVILCILLVCLGCAHCKPTAEKNSQDHVKCLTILSQPTNLTVSINGIYIGRTPKAVYFNVYDDCCVLYTNLNNAEHNTPNNFNTARRELFSVRCDAPNTNAAEPQTLYEEPRAMETNDTMLFKFDNISKSTTNNNDFGLVLLQDGFTFSSEYFSAIDNVVLDEDFSRLINSNRLLTLPPDLLLKFTTNDLYRFAPLDSHIRYNYAGSEYLYVFVEPEAAPTIFGKLNRLSSTNLFGAHEVHNDWLRMDELHCSFVREIDSTDNAFSGVHQLIPKGWTNDLGSQSIQKIWIESGLTLTSSGFPLKRSESVRPVAFVTEKGLYLAIEHTFTAHFSKTYSVKAHLTFDLSKCQHIKETSRTLMDSFSDDLTKEFMKSPLSANRDLSQLPEKGQLIFVRNRKPSVVLSNGSLSSIYELSTYAVQWWLSDQSSGRSGTMVLGLGDGVGSLIYVNIEHDLEVSADRVYYSDAEPQEKMQTFLARYQECIQAAFTSAMKDLMTERLSQVAKYSNQKIILNGDLDENK